MNQVQKGRVPPKMESYLDGGVVPIRSVSDQVKREEDLRELSDMYTECLWYMEVDNPYAEHIYDLQTYLEYCLDRKVNVIPEGWILKKGLVNRLTYAKCLGKITELLFTTGLLRELLELNSKTDPVNEGVFIDG